MFLNHFELTDHPFAEKPPIDWLLRDERTQQALARLKFFEQQGAIALIIGQTGLGKSSLLRLFIDQLPHNRYHPIYLHLTPLNANAFLRLIVTKLGEKPLMGKDRMLLQILLMYWGAKRLYCRCSDRGSRVGLRCRHQCLHNLATAPADLPKLLRCTPPDRRALWRLQILQELPNVCGNRLFRTLFYIAGWNSLGGVVLNIERPFIDTSRGRKDYVSPLQLALVMASI